MSRTRNEYDSITGSRVSRYNGAVTYSTKTVKNNTCVDEVTTGDNSPLDITKYERYGGTMSGVNGTPQTGAYWYDWPFVYNIEAALSSLYYLDQPKTDGQYAVDVLSRTNPSRPSVNALVNLVELREIPSLIKDAGEYRWRKLIKYIGLSKWRFLKRSAKLNLMIQFGILPLIDDVKKSLEFASLVDKRVKELERLSTRGLRRTIHDLDTVEATNISNEIMQSASGMVIRADVARKRTTQIGGHVRWYSTSPGQIDTDLERLALARKIISGSTVNFQSIWQALPWTWLIGWFSNLDSIVAASRNTVSVYHSAVRLTKHRSSTISTSNYTGKPSGITLVTLSGRSDSKKRVIATPTINAQTDFLEIGQLSILGSLSITKIFR